MVADNMQFEFTHASAKELIEFESVKQILQNAIARPKNLSQIKSDKFRLHHYEKTGSALVFFNTSEKLVVKFGGCVYFKNEVVYKYTIPTAFTKQINLGHVRVQPMADISETSVRKAFAFFRGKTSAVVGDDIHDGNVGIYNNEYVLIDW